MVFLLIKSANVPDHQLVCQTKLAAHFCAFFRLIGIRSCIDGIVDNLIWCATEHPVARVLAASKKIRSVFWNAPLVPQLDGVFQVFILIRIVAVGNPHRNMMLRRSL